MIAAAAIASLMLAQAATPAVVPTPDSNGDSAATITDRRLRLCLEQARKDPPTAINAANTWLIGARGIQESEAQQCLGFAYVTLTRWDAARQAFVAARDARPAGDLAARARLGAMAGNAALGASEWVTAVPLLDTAQADAIKAGKTALAGSIAADRARAFVGLGQIDDAARALEQARGWNAQDSEIWLLSATLARRQNHLTSAHDFIARATALAPHDPGVLLEAGLIAALRGENDAARSAWNAVLATSPDSREATAARSYLQQLGAPPTPAPSPTP